MSANQRHSFGMGVITKKSVQAVLGRRPRRARPDKLSGIRRDGICPTFFLKIESAKKVFEYETGLILEWDGNSKYCCQIDEDKIETIEAWEKKRDKLIYLRDCLSLSVALDTNFDNDSGERTDIGRLEFRGKNRNDKTVITPLADIVSKTIQDIPGYKCADLICSVPSSKTPNFPSKITSLVSKNVGKQDVTNGFNFAGKKLPIKKASFDKKWDNWEKAMVSFKNSPKCDVRGKTIILIDDKYQSGITIQYIAMKLQQAGASKVYGLCFVKTLRDTDNR